tara:strand:- start:44 stop:694 length:651 start_codon:yes stop_codon:yes gene_type:complete
MSKTPFYKKGLGTYQGQTPDGALLYADSPLHHQTSKKHPHAPGKENQSHVSVLVGPDYGKEKEQEEDPKAGLDPRFGWNEDGDRPINIKDSRYSDISYKPFEQTYKDAVANTGIFDPTDVRNQEWGGFMMHQGKKITGEDFNNLTYNDIRNKEFMKVKIPGQKLINNTLSEEEFKDMKKAYTAHRDYRKSTAAMRENVIAYKEAGGSFRKPLVTKT